MPAIKFLGVVLPLLTFVMALILTHDRPYQAENFQYANPPTLPVKNPGNAKKKKQAITFLGDLCNIEKI